MEKSPEKMTTRVHKGTDIGGLTAVICNCQKKKKKKKNIQIFQRGVTEKLME